MPRASHRCCHRGKSGAASQARFPHRWSATMLRMASLIRRARSLAWMPGAAVLSLLAAAAIAGCGADVQDPSGAHSVGAGAGGAPTTITSGGAGAPGGPACEPGDAPELLAAGEPGAVALALDAEFVYFWVGHGLTCT